MLVNFVELTYIDTQKFPLDCIKKEKNCVNTKLQGHIYKSKTKKKERRIYKRKEKCSLITNANFNRKTCSRSFVSSLVFYFVYLFFLFSVLHAQ